MTLQVSRVQSIGLWKNKSFSILLASTFLLSIANKIYELLLPLVMYELTRSSVVVSSMRTAELLPNLLFGIFIGVMVDRVNKKRWVLWMIGCQAILLLGMAYLIKTNTTLLFPYYTIGFLLMTFSYGYFNAQVSLIKTTVHSSQLTAANAKFSFMDTFVTIMGPMISGFILLLPFLYDGLWITSIVYFIAFLLLTQIKLPVMETVSKKQPFFKDLKTGWVFFMNNKPLLTMTMFIIFLNCSFTVVSTMVIIFAKEELNMSSSMIAIVMSASGIGGIMASNVVARLRERYGIGKLFGLTAIWNAIGYLGLFFTENTYFLVISLFIVGFAGAIYGVCAYTFRLEQTPADLIGKISGITGTLFRLGMPVAMYFSGYVVEWWGTSTVFISACLLNIVVFIVYTRTYLWRM
ncbi:MFS transporter [Neobacillus sp. D3-1R]|uniref:MFS transporter n=1 Tax=Neobacillus sp. D3-1R TaxID=3445778 RepID=UPI003F9FDDBC